MSFDVVDYGVGTLRAIKGLVLKAGNQFVAPNLSTSQDVRRSNGQPEFSTMAKNKNHSLKEKMYFVNVVYTVRKSKDDALKRPKLLQRLAYSSHTLLHYYFINQKSRNTVLLFTCRPSSQLAALSNHSQSISFAKR